MLSDMVHVGFGNMLTMNRIIAITSPASSPTKRSILNARNDNKLIDMTNGRRTKAVIFLDSGHVVLAALSIETLTNRLQVGRPITAAREEMNDDNEDETEDEQQ